MSVTKLLKLQVETMSSTCDAKIYLTNRINC